MRLFSAEIALEVSDVTADPVELTAAVRTDSEAWARATSDARDDDVAPVLAAMAFSRAVALEVSEARLADMPDSAPVARVVSLVRADAVLLSAAYIETVLELRAAMEAPWIVDDTATESSRMDRAAVLAERAVVLAATAGLVP